MNSKRKITTALVLCAALGGIYAAVQISGDETAASADKTEMPHDQYPKATKQIALTFDDGPSPKTPETLRIAKSYDAKVSFFLVGQHATKYPKLARRVVEQGHTLGSHSLSHADLTSLGENEIRYEIGMGDRKVMEAAGEWPAYFRAPYGYMNERVERVMHELGFGSMTGWSLDSFDWKSKSAEEVKNRVLDNATDGDVVLMHDSLEVTREALPSIMNELRKRGFELIALSDE